MTQSLRLIAKVAEKISCCIKHLLIDELKDTCLVPCTVISSERDTNPTLSDVSSTTKLLTGLFTATAGASCF